jgi:hypothetical protein
VKTTGDDRRPQLKRWFSPLISTDFRVTLPPAYQWPPEWRARRHDIDALLADEDGFLVQGLFAAHDLVVATGSEAPAQRPIVELQRECEARYPGLLPGKHGRNLLWAVLCGSVFNPYERDKEAPSRPCDDHGNPLPDGLYPRRDLTELLAEPYYQLRDTCARPYFRPSIGNPRPRPYRSRIVEAERQRRFASRPRRSRLDSLRIKIGPLLKGDLANGRPPATYPEIARELGIDIKQLHKDCDRLRAQGVHLPAARDQKRLAKLLRMMISLRTDNSSKAQARPPQRARLRRDPWNPGGHTNGE